LVLSPYLRLWFWLFSRWVMCTDWTNTLLFVCLFVCMAWHDMGSLCMYVLMFLLFQARSLFFIIGATLLFVNSLKDVFPELFSLKTLYEMLTSEERGNLKLTTLLSPMRTCNNSACLVLWISSMHVKAVMTRCTVSDLLLPPFFACRWR
jgi:hypothetical protein